MSFTGEKSSKGWKKDGSKTSFALLEGDEDNDRDWNMKFPAVNFVGKKKSSKG